MDDLLRDVLIAPTRHEGVQPFFAVLWSVNGLSPDSKGGLNEAATVALIRAAIDSGAVTAVECARIEPSGAAERWAFDMDPVVGSMSPSDVAVALVCPRAWYPDEDGDHYPALVPVAVRGQADAT